MADTLKPCPFRCSRYRALSAAYDELFVWAQDWLGAYDLPPWYVRPRNIVKLVAENARLREEIARQREDAKTLAEFVYGWWPKMTNGMYPWPPPEDHRLIVAARRILGTDEPRPSEED